MSETAYLWMIIPVFVKVLATLNYIFLANVHLHKCGLMFIFTNVGFNLYDKLGKNEIINAVAFVVITCSTFV